MADNGGNKVIKPPTSLNDKVGIGGPGAVDLQAIERAEQAIANLAGDYLEWVEEDLERIQNAANALKSATGDDVASGLNDVFQISHDKNQSIVRVAPAKHQLCRMHLPMH